MKLDLDFSAMRSPRQTERPSVVRIRSENVNPDVVGERVVAALHQMATDLENGALLTVGLNRARLRVLPLQPRG